MVGADPRRRVGVERAADEAGRVAVGVRGAADLELREHLRVARDDAGEVHHLRHAQRPPAAQDRLHVARRQRAPRRLEAARRHARGRHHVDGQRQALGGVEHPVHAVGAEHVGDLVRVAHDRRRAVGEHRARELGGRELGGLDVHVRVDEPGHQVGAVGGQPLAAVEGADAGDPAVGDPHVAGQPLAREDREDPRALDDEVRLLVAAGDGDQPGPRAAGVAQPRDSCGASSVTSNRCAPASSAATTASPSAASTASRAPDRASSPGPASSASRRRRLERGAARVLGPGDREVRGQLGGRDRHHSPTMSSGRTGTRVSAAPVAARSAATIAGVEEIVGGSPMPRRP